jgi:chromate transporter
MLSSIIDQRDKFMEVLMKKDYSKLWTLFRSMFVLSACTFGGGFVIVSLMKKKYVEELQWLEEDEMLDVTAITQSAPGPLPVNASVIIGYRIAGVLGSLTAILGTILPPMIIISVISLFYEQFRTNTYVSIALQVMRAGVAAVIFDVVLNLAHNVLTTRRILYISMMIVAFAAACILDVSAMLIIFTCLGIGILDLIVQTYKEKHGGTV